MPSKPFGLSLIKQALPGAHKGGARGTFANRRMAAQLASAYEQARLGWFWATDRQGRLSYISGHIFEALGAEGTEIIGQPFSAVFALDQRQAGVAQRPLPFLISTGTSFTELTLSASGQSDGPWWAVSGIPKVGADGAFSGYFGHGRDITHTLRSEQAASRLARHDSLTGLANRHHMSGRLDDILVACQAAKRSCALMMVDLDRFKQVNDTLGHQAGDELLKQVAQRLASVVPHSAQIGRIGGDEFQIILPDVDDRGELGTLGERIVAMLSQPYSMEGARCVIGASLGIAIAPYDGLNSEELVRSADLALYAAKGAGRGQYRFYSSILHLHAEERRQLENDMRDALGAGQFRLAYQPIVALADNLISGFEALMRWEHPARGAISPAVFIPIAEDAGLIEALGEWALRQACADAAQWQGKARVAVNVSPIQFANAGLPSLVASALAASQLAPERLELEITESVFLGEDSNTQNMFAALKRLGVRLALDDFGTGYSSLGYLQKAPFARRSMHPGKAAGLPDGEG